MLYFENQFTKCIFYILDKFADQIRVLNSYLKTTSIKLHSVSSASSVQLLCPLIIWDALKAMHTLQ